MSDDGWQRLEQSLRELEEHEPAVKAARERIEYVTSSHEMWRRQMVRNLWSADEPK